MNSPYNGKILVDFTGRRYGRLVVLESFDVQPTRWLCICDCGELKVVRSGLLTGKMTRSCGCLNREKLKARAGQPVGNFLHGMSGSPEFKTWISMLARCTNAQANGYEKYGGRGIKICDEWLGSFLNFLKDMGPRPKGKSLDRIDNDGNYEPANCRWATWKEQNRNRSTSRPSWHYEEIEKIVEQKKVSFSWAAELFDRQRGVFRVRKRKSSSAKQLCD